MNYNDYEEALPQKNNRKKLIAILVILSFLAICVIVLIKLNNPTDPYVPSEEPSDVTMIYNAEDFLLLNDPEGGKFRLANDVDFSGVTDWVPFDFCGELDGNGYALVNIRFPNLIKKNSGTIKNLKINGLSISNDSSFTYETFVGMVKENTGRIANCKIFGATLSFATNVGFFAGYNSGIIEDCSVTNTTIQSNAAKGGGIAMDNYTEGSIRRCYTELSVTTYDLIFGGIVRNNAGAISTCYSRCSIDAEVYKYGAGTSITATAQVGGIASYNDCKIKDCYAVLLLNASTSASNTAPTAGMIGTSATSTVYAGGIAGVNHGDVESSFASVNLFTKVDGYDKGGDLTLNNYTGYLHGRYQTDYSIGTLTNSYYAQEDVIVAQKQDKAVSYNQDGNKTSTSNLRQKEFCVGTLGWNEADWSFSEYDYPTLKPAS